MRDQYTLTLTGRQTFGNTTVALDPNGIYIIRQSDGETTTEIYLTQPEARLVVGILQSLIAIDVSAGA